ncbi:hypothetical protein PENTCL1PPCAC_16364, partial [Pristionchus entomophagus]
MIELTDSRKRWLLFTIVTIPALLFCFVFLLVKLYAFPRVLSELFTLRISENASIPLITRHWVNFPADILFKFHLWNITNPDEGVLKFMDGKLLGTAIPAQPKAGGLLPFYNNSYEPEFRVRTGLGNIVDLTKIISYGGQKSTDWNIGEELQNCNVGAINKQFLQPEDNLHVFLSYLGRSFEMEFHVETTHDSIPAFVYRITEDEYNTNSEKKKGMRYENAEGRDYFPKWPACPNDRFFNPNSTSCRNIDCSREQNLCDDCCNGSHYNGTVFTPPGFYTLRVYPGRLDKAPIPLFVSPPHMLWAPKEVSSIYAGQRPDEDKHRPIEWFVSPTLGILVGAKARIQMNIPLWRGDMTKSTSLPNSMAPILWLEIEAILHEDMVFIVKLAGLYLPLFFNCALFFLLLVAFISSSVIGLDKITRILDKPKPPTRIRVRIKIPTAQDITREQG